MRCPVCQNQFEPGGNAAAPFCSERCREVDLGRWLGEAYTLPVVADPEADETPESFEPPAQENDR
ncbi:MAG: DNA gyrase inhibitor YacG [Planctomycetota bacterium]